MVNLQSFRSRIPDVRSIKLTFSSIITFYLPKTESRNRKPLTQPDTIAFSKGTVFAKENSIFFAKNIPSSALKRPWY